MEGFDREEKDECDKKKRKKKKIIQIKRREQKINCVTIQKIYHLSRSGKSEMNI